jgi:hypothetical protein
MSAPASIINPLGPSSQWGLVLKNIMDQADEITSVDVPLDLPEVNANGFERFATQAVKAAIATAAISRGHGELLAALRADVQDIALTGLQKVALPGVEQLKLSIEKMAVPLASSCFDQAECDGCRFNSTNHHGVFAVAIKDGLCVNRQCAADKTEKALNQHAEALRTRYKTVMLRPVPWVQVTDKELGEPQASFCRTECPSFGAVLLAEPGRSISAAAGVCTNTACHAVKRDEPKRVALTAYKLKLWRHAVSSHLFKLPVEQSRAVLLALFACGWTAGPSLRDGLAEGGDPKLARLLQASLTFDREQLVRQFNDLGVHLVNAATEDQLRELIHALQIRVQQWWKMPSTLVSQLPAEALELLVADLQLGEDSVVVKAKADSYAAYSAAVEARIESMDVKGFLPSFFRP